MTSFNLIDQPWIPVLTGTGEQEQVSISTALTQASSFVRIGAELATVSIAIQRLLQAILLRVAQPLPRSREDRAERWAQWWEDGGLPAADIERYLSTWYDRFDLFHPQTPFFQVPGLSLKSGAGSGLYKIIADVPAGTKFFTTRSGDAISRLSFAEAAAWLVHAQAFDCAGIKSGVLGDDRVKDGKSHSFGYPAWSGAIGIISVEGINLGETLLLNLDLTATSSDDAPAWETAPQRIASDGIYPAPIGAAQVWTWPSRMIRLLTEDTDVVDVVLSNGEKLTPQNRNAVEPMTSWKRSDVQSKKLGGDVFMPVGHDPTRAAWRSLSGLLAQSPTGIHEQRDAAGVLKWISILKGEEIIPDDLPVRLRCVAMIYGSNASTFSQDFDDPVALQVATLTSATLRSLSVDAVEAARRGILSLRDFARNVELAAGDSGDDVPGKIQGLEVDAYDQLRTPFEEWLGSLTSDTDTEVAATDWERTVARMIWQIAMDHAQRCPATAVFGRPINLKKPGADKDKKDIHMDLGLAQVWLRASLRRVLPLAHPSTSKEGSDDAVNDTTDQ